MTLPASGPISFGDINIEMDRSENTQLDINESSVRETFMATSASGSQISIDQGYGDAYWKYSEVDRYYWLVLADLGFAAWDYGGGGSPTVGVNDTQADDGGFRYYKGVYVETISGYPAYKIRRIKL